MSEVTAQQRAALDRYVADRVRQGWRAEPVSATSVQLVYRKRVRHVLHLVLSLVTMGAWLLVWLVLVLWNRERRVIVSVDSQGRVSES